MSKTYQVLSQRAPFLIYFFFVAFLLPVNKSYGQDANYWSSNYGPGGFLTPGATLSNNRDSGVFFFNPALFAFSQKNSASISGTIYQYQTIKVSNGVGTGLPLSSSGGSVIPQMVSNTISLKMKRPFTIAYALTHDPVMNFSTTQRRDDKFNVLRDSYSPGPEYFLGQYSALNSINTTTGILSIGTKISPRIAAGLSMEGSIRKQIFSINYSSRALINAGPDTLLKPIASAEENYQVNYTHSGIWFKAGLAYEADEKNHFGITLSTPLFHLAGSATLVSDNQLSNLVLDSNFNVYLLASTRQTGLKPRWKMPVSAALGFTHDLDKAQVYCSMEYFAKMTEYNIITPRNDYFIRPDTANNTATADLLKLVDARKPVLNIAIGISYVFDSVITGYFSLRTDFSYSGNYKDNDGTRSNTSEWNQYHTQIGANLKRRKFNLRVGLLLTYGTTGKYQQPLNFDDPNETNLLLGNPHTTHARNLAAGLLLAYLHNF